MQVDHGNYLGMISIRDVVCPLCLQAICIDDAEDNKTMPPILQLALPAAVAAVSTSAGPL